MDSLLQYFWTDLAWYVLLGVALYLLDRYVGARFYRWYYDRTRKSAMPEGEEHGFVYRQSRSAQVTKAFIVCIIAVVILHAVFGKERNWITEAVLLVPETLAVLVGFLLGSVLYAAVPHMRPALKKLDDIDPDAIKRGAQAFGAEAVGRASSLADTIREQVAPKPRPPQVFDHVPSAEDAQEPPQENVHDVLNRYTKGNG